MSKNKTVKTEPIVHTADTSVKIKQEKPKTQYTTEIPQLKGEPKSMDFALAKENYILLLIGFVIIIVGFVLMIGGGTDDPNVFNGDEIFSFRRITLAPIVVLLGFAFEIWAIMKKPKQEEV